jgi:hypothetical protein
VRGLAVNNPPSVTRRATFATTTAAASAAITSATTSTATTPAITTEERVEEAPRVHKPASVSQRSLEA